MGSSFGEDNIRTHFRVLMMGTGLGPGGSFDLGVKEMMKALRRNAKQAVMTIRSQVSIFSG